MRSLIQMLILHGLTRNKRYANIVPTMVLSGLPISVDELLVILHTFEHNVNKIDPTPTSVKPSTAQTLSGSKSRGLFDLFGEIQRLNRNLESNRNIHQRQSNQTQTSNNQEYGRNDNRQGANRRP